MECPNWPNVFWHAVKKLLLVVYVDDFKLSGPENQLEWFFDELRKHVDIEDPVPEKGPELDKEAVTARFLGLAVPCSRRARLIRRTEQFKVRRSILSESAL